MQKISSHIVLVRGNCEKSAQNNLLHFFRKTTLVQYDHLEISKEKTINASDQTFSSQIDVAIGKNRQIVAKLVAELKAEGLSEINDLERVAQGYPSKVLHILTHFLDGFIGIDSAFYNLPEDSHWLSNELETTVLQNPKEYWLFYLTGYSYTPDEASLIQH